MKTHMKLGAALTAGTLFAAPAAAETYSVSFGPSVIADTLSIEGVDDGEIGGEIAVFDFSDGSLGEQLASELVGGVGGTNVMFTFDEGSMPQGDLVVISYDAVGNEIDREILQLQ